LAQARLVTAEHLIPKELESIAANTPIVFLGTGLFDPELEYVAHTVLHEAWESPHDKYMVRLPPDQDANDGYVRIEIGMWDRIKQRAMQSKLRTVEESSESFLERLMGAR
jgi:hypothetical protein